MASNNINKFLLNEGFSEIKKQHVYKKNLFNDYSVQIKPKIVSGCNFQEMYIYIFSSRFGIIMDTLFEKRNSIAWEYLPRKLRNDSEGCLGMALVTYENYCESEKDKFIFGKKELSLEEFLSRIYELNSVQNLYDSIYQEKGFLIESLNFIEGLWVYLYLSNEINKSSKSILSDIRLNILANILKKWRLRKEIDNELLDFFKDIYDL